MEKLKSIVLIDDSEVDNFLHKKVIEKAEIAENVTAFTRAREALQWLTKPDDHGRYASPDLIFLDVNMPGMDGWEFLDAYKQAPEAKKENLLIVMLTTSLNPMDWKKAQASKMVSGFHTKPLNADTLYKIALNSR